MESDVFEEVTYAQYTVRFPPKYNIPERTFGPKQGGFKHAVNYRDAMARKHHIIITPLNYNFRPPRGKDGEKKYKRGRIVTCGPTYDGRFEYIVETDDHQHIRRIIQSSAFKNQKIIKAVSDDLGKGFTPEMFKLEHRDLIGMRVVVRGKYNKYLDEWQIMTCRPDREVLQDTSPNENKEECTMIEMIDCVGKANEPLTPEQEAMVERIVARRLEEALKGLAERIATPAPQVVSIKKDASD